MVFKVGIVVPPKELHKLQFEGFKLGRVTMEVLRLGEVEVRARCKGLRCLGRVKLVLEILILLAHNKIELEYLLAELDDAIAGLHVAIAELVAELAATIVPVSCHKHRNQPCGKA